MASRREFIRNCGTMAGAAGFSYVGLSSQGILDKSVMPGKGKNMTLSYRPYDVELKHVFTIATSSRKSTPVMLTEIEYDGIIGLGEASMPPYLGESHETVANFLKKVDLAKFSSPFLMEEILNYIEQLAPGNYAAKASVDIALHDLVGKLMNQPWYRIWGLNPDKTPFTSFTIGIDKPDVVRKKVEEAAPYKILKVKLGQENDKEMIETIRSVSATPLCVDVNQGWKDRKMALDMIYWLKDKGVVFVEQPMPKSLVEDLIWLTQNSPLPVIADESVQTISDVKKADGVYSGINIKLMKCGGMRSAFKMINTARALNLKVMIGCMTETSCAISAAAQLSPMVDWADLDGNLLINNDIFEGVKIENGKIVLADAPGIGVKKL
jgi:L-alanine-DL-glutamate epimerase-like enolase superfamily enzyme